MADPSSGTDDIPGGTDAGAGVDIGVLGPLIVRVDGAEVVVTAARERAVLTCLALHVGSTVSDGRLIESVWGDDPPASARSTLQTYISHLRKVLGASVVVRDANGYRLTGVVVDADVFEERLDAVRDVAADGGDAGDVGAAPDDRRIEALTDALARWRGAPCPDGDDLALEAARARLEERRLNAAEELVELRLDRGEDAALIPDLEELCRRHPLRERAAGLLMVALYRADRQADALAVERRLRAGLLDELGLDPGPGIRDLEQRILEQDPQLLVPDRSGPRVAGGCGPSADADRAAGGARDRGASTSATTEGSPEPGPLPFPARLTPSRADAPLVGRRSELAHLDALIDQAAAGAVVPVVVLRGEAGIGKTRLAREMARRLSLDPAGSERPWLVAWGRCPADSGGGFQPFAEALDHLVGWRPSLAAGSEGLLAPVLPSLARATDPLALLRTGAEQRFAVIDALSEVVARASAIGPVLLVIDDLHWADPGSTALLEHLASRRLPGVVVLATARNPEPTETAPYARLLEQLDRDHELDTLDVVGLTEAEVRVLVDRTTDTAAPIEAVALLHTQTRGNPFFVGEVLAALGSDGVHDLEAEVPLTSGVQSVLAQRLDHLSPDEEAVMAAAAVLGLEFDLDSVAACADVSADDALDALEHAAAMALVEESAQPGAFAFSHALVQVAITSRTPRTRRSRLVARAAELAAARTMAEPGALGRRVASTLLAAATEDVVTGPRPLDERDPQLAMSRATLLRIAAGASPLLDRPGVEVVVASDLTDERAGRTVLRWAEAMHRRGDSAPALARAVEVGELARQLPSPGLLVEAALVAADAGGLAAGSGSPDGRIELQSLVTDALGAVGNDPADDARRARLLVHLAMTADDPDDRRLLAGAARMAAERAGDESWQAEAILVERGTRWGPRDALERVVLGRRALVLATPSGRSALSAPVVDRGLVARIESTLARDLLVVGEPAEARAVLDGLMARDGVPRVLVARARLQRAGIDLFEGDTNAASSAVERAVAGDYVRSRDPHDPLATLLLVVARAQGQLAEARVSLRDASRRWPDDLLWTGALAAAETDAGEVVAATTILDAAVASVEANPTGPGAVGGLVLLLDAADRLDHGLVGSLRARLAPHAGELAVAGDAGTLGPV